MRFRIPITVTQTKTGYKASPLFFDGPVREDVNLNRLLSKLHRDLVNELETLAKKNRHDDLARWVFAPAVNAHRLILKIPLRRRIATIKYLFATFEQSGRKLAFATALPKVWFEIARGELLSDRATEIMSDYWRNVERDANDEKSVRPEQWNLVGKSWIQTIEVTARTCLTSIKVEKPMFLMIGQEGTPDGASELRRVGRCLDSLDTTELDRAILRDREIGELMQLLESRDRRPILLLGPRQCGKTAIIHESVRRRSTLPREHSQQRGQVWLVSPQRLISGMSYVGQWEGRLLAILRHVRKRDHILYFDDLIGLFLAGQTSQTSLNVAMVLKPYLERHAVRVLAEITPEQFRVLQERDRGFADLFHVLPIHEPNESQTLRILIEHQRRLEGQYECSFALETLPTVIDHARRFDRGAAFPGKAATILARLAVRALGGKTQHTASARIRLFHRPTINRLDVLNDFATRSGLSLAFLDPNERLDRDEIRDQLARQIVGQSEAVESLADVISIAKARLNDPGRPIASFLFLGPTGVGKTECAKAAAHVLFGDAERLLRIDLNEYNQPGSAARLVGTFAQPEGLMTSAIRRQPFSIILLDEIEKADRDVFDVLLQVLGEGRLTDALGRTADFTNAIVLMTSNLGVREAEGNLGFGPSSENERTYHKAAEAFFRPEFFNRIDRIIPFRKLIREELGQIAQRLIGDVLAREGFAQRQCAMNITPDAIERVIDAGYEPALGARAMKRAIERELTRTAAAKLATIRMDEFSVITIRSSDNGLIVQVDTPGWVPKLEPRESGTREQRLDACHDAFEQLAAAIAGIRPRGPITGTISLEQERYFEVKERLDRIAAMLEAIEERDERRRVAKIEGISSSGLGQRSRYRIPPEAKHFDPDGRSALNMIVSSFSMEEAIQELFAGFVPVELDDELDEIEQQLGLARLLARVPVHEESTYLWIRPFSGGDQAKLLGQYYREAWSSDLGLECERYDPPELAEGHVVLVIRGLHARAIAQTEVGTHLFLPKRGGPVPVRVHVIASWPTVLADSHRFEPIVRVYPEGRPIVDARTGLAMPMPFEAELFRGFTLAAIAAMP